MTARNKAFGSDFFNFYKFSNLSNGSDFFNFSNFSNF